MKKKIGLIAWFLLLSLLVSPLTSVRGDIDDEIKKANEVKKMLEEQIKAENAQIESFRNKQSQEERELNKIESNLNTLQAKISALALEIEKTNQEYLNLNTEMEKLKLSIEEKEIRMKKLLQVLYENYTMSFNAYLFTSKNINEIIDKAVYLQYLFEADKTFFRTLKEDKKDLVEKQKYQVEIQMKLGSEKSELDKKNTEYMALEQQKNTQIADFAYKIQFHVDSKNEAIRNLDATDAFIKALLKKKAEEERRKRLLKAPFGSGTIIWPIPGTVSSPFGMRLHPIFGVNRMHTGVDIDGASGTPIKSVTIGEVVFAGWLSGYGNTVMIQHDEFYSTLYAHMRVIYVKEGAPVKQGTVIGEVGTTGWSTEPHLHFEIRKDGEPINPMTFLSQ